LLTDQQFPEGRPTARFLEDAAARG